MRQSVTVAGGVSVSRISHPGHCQAYRLMLLHTASTDIRQLTELPSGSSLHDAR
jgi:hypothetical protein